MEEIKVITAHDTFKVSSPRPAGGMVIDDNTVSPKNVSEPDVKEQKGGNKKVDVAELVEKANKHVDNFSTKVSFRYDEKRQQAVITVAERETGKVIRQIPAEQMVDLMEKMEEIAGIIYNGRA